MTDVQFHSLDDGRRIAFKHLQGSGPTLVFLPGYMSDMSGGKASALFARAQEQGRACMLLDYSGCGASDGKFSDGSLSLWRDEVNELIRAHVEGEVLLVGSSMGGWLMLLVAESLADRLAGMIGIAAAPDFTVWGFSPEQRARMASGETIFEDNPYGPEPTPTYAKFFADGEANTRLSQEIAIDCPVRLLHGQNDADVPWKISLQLAEALRSDNIQVCLVKDGDHRLSREPDIALLSYQVDQFY
ncbi:MAG: alpha/beta hydrolase [Erythrobacter sp.]